ncbi:CAP domain-containing protein [Bacillus tianshenii]|uniref:CAP domain-containing protein n=1 Tax=Sutcliffiella tianshenii TaxID=1463404 RepID=UPI001CD718C8|nr:CAP domain-containing protein [Bacillus tianshenii]MCA1322286.1 CAP domain-containing protein [Bacillus tianshenii]
MRGLFILLFVAFCLYLFVNVEPQQLEGLLGNQPHTEMGESNNAEEQAVIQSKIQSSDTAEGVASFIGKSVSELLDTYGEPKRKDLSAYDYVWYIYHDHPSEYVQFGVEDGKVVTAFSTGEASNNNPFQIGTSYDSLNKEWSFADSVTVLYEEGSYRFEMKEEELQTRPLVLLGDVYAQLYFDSFDKTLSSVRYLNAETLIKQRPYELVYKGPLLDPKELSPEEWAAVEAGAEQQIIDFTNMIRNRFELAPVAWHEETADVAFMHSKDMNESDYFSHTSPTAGSLSDRLTAGDVPFQYAGENIAAQYVDGIAAVEGWLNSEGHRKTLLNERFTHLGVGVNEKYYTQNFIETW